MSDQRDLAILAAQKIIVNLEVKLRRERELTDNLIASVNRLLSAGHPGVFETIRVVEALDDIKRARSEK